MTYHIRSWARPVTAFTLITAAFGAPSALPPVAPTMTRVADGVLLFTTPPYGDVGLDGNSVAIVGSDGVLVFDTNGTPAAASAVLSEIRRVTDRPVRFIVNSHWHWDHWYGNEVYQQAFPDVRIIAHEKTRELMMGPALEFNRPGIETQLPAYIAALEKKVEAASAATPPPDDLPQLKQRLADDRFFLEQKAHVRHVFPNVTFTKAMTVYLGDREVQVLHYDRAVTPGDAFLYLPKEKIVVTGDLLVNPISFALSCYPGGWLETLERIDALDATVIVPGHGAPLRDKTLLRATTTLFRRMIEGGRAAKQAGLDVHQARDAMWPSLRETMEKITGGDPKLEAPFRVQLVDWFLHRVYEELDGPLTDAIAPIPPSVI